MRLLILFCFSFVFGFGAVPGTLDTSFSNGGLYREEFDQADQVVATAVLDDFNLLVVRTKNRRTDGEDHTPYQSVSFSKLSPEGQKVAAFGSVKPFNETDGVVESVFPRKAGIFPGGNFFVAGCFGNRTISPTDGAAGGGEYLWIGVFDQVTGEANPSFGEGGHLMVPHDQSSDSECVVDLVLTENENILIVAVMNIGQRRQTATIQASMSGVVDDVRGIVSLEVDPHFTNEGACAFALPNGTLFVAGTAARDAQGHSRVFSAIIGSDGLVLSQSLLRFPDEQVNVNMSSPGFVYDNSTKISSCVRSPDGGVYVAGIAPGSYWAVAKFSPRSVALDPNFGEGGVTVLTTTTSSRFSQWNVHTVVLPTGSMVMGGTTGSFFPFRTTFVRILPSGLVDSTWDSSFPGYGATRIHAMQMQNNGRLLVSGQLFSPASDGFTFRLHCEESATTCDAGPQCFCVGASCMTQTDYVAPVNAPSINGTVFINGNMVSSNGTVQITPVPYGSGMVTVGGLVYAAGTLSIHVNASGTYEVITSDQGFEGAYDHIVVDPADLQECEQGLTTPMTSADGTTLSVAIQIQRTPGCLTVGETVGLAVGVIAFGIVLALVLVIIHRYRLKSWTTRHNQEIKEGDLNDLTPLGGLPPNPMFIRDPSTEMTQSSDSGSLSF